MALVSLCENDQMIILVPISSASRTSGASVALFTFNSYLVPISSASRTHGASVAYLILI